jgi:hypothetical protein
MPATFKIKTARRPLSWLLKLCGLGGCASFWGTIYALPGRENDERLIRHEKCHLDQIESDGPLIFSLVYIYWLFRFGNDANPYEVEARASEVIPSMS